MNASDYGKVYSSLQEARRVIARNVKKSNDGVLQIQYDRLGNIIKVICNLQIKEEQDEN